MSSLDVIFLDQKLNVSAVSEHRLVLSFDSLKIILHNSRGCMFDDISTLKHLLEHSTSTLGVWVNHVIIHKNIYRVSQEECARLRESVPYVKVYRYNPKHLYPKLNGYGDNGQRKVGGGVLAVPNTVTCTPDSANVLESGMQCSLCLRDG